MKICIIGGGITGLSSAYKLATLGHDVKIFEASSFSGGQASTLKIKNFEIEKAYHHLFVTDKAILQLYKELEIENELEWFHSSVATYSNDKIWPTDVRTTQRCSRLKRSRNSNGSSPPGGAQAPPGCRTGSADPCEFQSV